MLAQQCGSREKGVILEGFFCLGLCLSVLGFFPILSSLQALALAADLAFFHQAGTNFAICLPLS